MAEQSLAPPPMLEQCLDAFPEADAVIRSHSASSAALSTSRSRSLQENNQRGAHSRSLVPHTGESEQTRVGAGIVLIET